MTKKNEGRKDRAGRGKSLNLNIMKKAINMAVLCLTALMLRVNPNHLGAINAFVVTGTPPLPLRSYRTTGKGEGKDLKKCPRLINQSLNAAVRKVLLG